MIAIFDNETQAVEFSNEIHNFLKANRPGYIAERWSDIDKSDIDNLWAVPIPEDFEEVFTAETIVNAYPNGWLTAIITT